MAVRGPYGDVCVSKANSQHLCIYTKAHFLRVRECESAHFARPHAKQQTVRFVWVCRWVDEIKVAAGRLRGPDVIVTAGHTDPPQVWPYRRSAAKLTNVSRSVVVPQIWHASPSHHCWAQPSLHLSLFTVRTARLMYTHRPGKKILSEILQFQMYTMRLSYFYNYMRCKSGRLLPDIYVHVNYCYE